MLMKMEKLQDCFEFIRQVDTKSAEETIEAGTAFAVMLKPGDGVLYKGEMGAGKTYFTKGIAKYLKSKEPVTSPTFAIVNEYPAEIPIFHFDLFRINSEDDLYATGFYDYLSRNGVICVEWSENVPELTELFNICFIVSIVKTGENLRRITITRREVK